MYERGTNKRDVYDDKDTIPTDIVDNVVNNVIAYYVCILIAHSTLPFTNYKRKTLLHDLVINYFRQPN